MRVLRLALVTLLLPLVGCTPGTAPAPDPTPASITAPVPPPVPSPSTVLCPDGAYVVSALKGHGAGSALRRGTGGDIAATFVGGVFTLSSEGSTPMAVDLGPVDGELRFTGAITSTYAGPPEALVLSVTSATGEVSIKGFGVARTASAEQLAGQLISSGTTAQVTCDDAAGTAVVVLPSASLTLTRKG